MRFTSFPFSLFPKRLRAAIPGKINVIAVRRFRVAHGAPALQAISDKQNAEQRVKRRNE